MHMNLSGKTTCLIRPLYMANEVGLITQIWLYYYYIHVHTGLTVDWPDCWLIVWRHPGGSSLRSGQSITPSQYLSRAIQSPISQLVLNGPKFSDHDRNNSRKSYVSCIPLRSKADQSRGVLHESRNKEWIHSLIWNDYTMMTKVTIAIQATLLPE